MIDLGPHASFIISAYLGVALVTLGLIVATIADAHRQKSRLKALEAMGIRRQSAIKPKTKRNTKT